MVLPSPAGPEIPYPLQYRFGPFVTLVGMKRGEALPFILSVSPRRRT